MYEWGEDPDRQKANTKEEESDLGLLNEGFRYRDLDTGTFLTRDPIGYADGPNVYCYVHCNPITHFDALGLSDTSESEAYQQALEDAARAQEEAERAQEQAQEAQEKAEQAQQAANEAAKNGPTIGAAQKADEARAANEAAQKAQTDALGASQAATKAQARADLLGSCPTAEAADALAWALDNIGNPDYGKYGEVDNFKSGQNKCNKFLNDAYEDGAGVDFPNRTGRFGIPRDQPPKANDLADPANNYQNFPVVSGPPEPGDALAFPSNRSDGHAAIYGGNGQIIQGGSRAGSISPMNQMLRDHGGNVTIRRYTD